MKKSGVRLAAALMVAGALLALTSCFYMPGVGGRPAKAGISIGRSLLPSNLSSIAVIVGGPGMEPITVRYEPGITTTTLSVPSGVARTFTVLANTQSVTFRDDATVDLAPDESRQIDLVPKLSATQIIVPDSLNGRIAQVSDMQGHGWQETYMEDSISDVDFDSQGRIYVAGTGTIYQMDDILSGYTNSIGTESSVAYITVDRARDLLYWADANGYLYRVHVPFDGSGAEQVWLGSPNEGGIHAIGIAVDPDGLVYVADGNTSEIKKINPTPAESPQIVKTYSGAGDTPLDSPSDILVKDDGVYVIDHGSLRVVHLSRNLDFLGSLSGHGTDSFLGPERFVAIMNKPITIIDETSQSDLEEKDRLVSFNDMTGAGWTTYGTTGSDIGYFMFFNQYYAP